MSTTIFVHRASVCDLLLYSDTPYKHAVSIFKKLSGVKEVAEDPEEDIEGYVVGSTPGLSVSLHSEEFLPIGYNPRGTAIVDKITGLEDNEPKGFIPYKSLTPVNLTTKTPEEHDRARVDELTEQAFKHFSIHFKMDKWTKAYNESQLCQSTEEELKHWASVLYNADHEMDMDF